VEIKPYLLKNMIQHYEWGTRDDQAFIPEFLGIKPEPGKPYAELWMGAHPKAPSVIIENGNETELDRMIEQFPIEMLGPEVINKFNGDLPFLFKILSIAEPLSIQAHPSKVQARELHQNDPLNYPDENHKPEIAIALDSLSALCGFRSVEEIKDVFEKYDALSMLLDDNEIYELNNMNSENIETHRNCLKRVYSKLMKSPILNERLFNNVIDRVFAQISATVAKNEREDLYIKCSKKYPYDVGLFSIFLLNLVHLKSGEGLFLGPGIAHAYLEGTIVECMANSDNVIRAGLTPKSKDVNRLTEVLTYQTGSVEIIPADNNDVQIYKTPAAEFEVSRIRLQPNEGMILSRENRPEIILIYSGGCDFSWNEGSKESYNKGHVIFIPASLGQLKIVSRKESTLFRVRIPQIPASS
jgi:mannose-6-phosphate isomerase